MGHVAIGYKHHPSYSQETTEKIVKAFDIFVTLPALFKDNDTRRRELYGKPGSFRFKDFGVECRALSNFWIHNEENRNWVFNQTLKAVNCVLDGEADQLIKDWSEKTKDAITNNNLVLAEEIINFTQVKNKMII